MKTLALTLAALTLTACYSGGEPLLGFGTRAEGDGPNVVWDVDAKPLPEIPFPNDVATRTDLSSATGRRVNASRAADTSFERRLRDYLSELDGFGTFAATWIQFDARLDLANIALRQTGDANFDDDVVFLVDVTPDSPTYGELQVLDFGGGSYPVTVEKTDRYFENDPRSLASNIIYDTYDEDIDGDGNFDVWEDADQDGRLDTDEDSNGNGELDEGEDLDGDGHLDVNEDLDDDGRLDVDEDSDGDGVFDVPNLWGSVIEGSVELPNHPNHPGHPNHPFFDLITFYELESNTLVFRPMVPLREQTTYAVVITKELVGENGDAVRSPWEYVHHLQQIETVAPIFEDGVLSDYVDNDNVAFAWSFTTQSTTTDLVRLREGLHGIGPLAHLADTYPAVIEQIVPIDDDLGNEAFLLRPDQLVEALAVVFENIDVGGFDAEQIQPLLDTYGAVDYMIAGDYGSLDLVDVAGGVFDLDTAAGIGKHQAESRRFILIVPKRAHGQAPFPVALYCHGYTSLKLEALAFAGILAKFGIATFVIDAYGHGIPLGPEFDPIIDLMLNEYGGESLRIFYDAIKVDRARDLNGDGIVDVGGDFWTNDTFHTRDIVRQTVVDYLQAIRVLQSFDGTTEWNVTLTDDGTDTHLAGDFNNDGMPDVGGPDNDYFAMGTSMGGILSSIIGALDPAIVAAAPVSSGGGLLEIGLRTDLTNVQRAVILPMLGPMVITEPHGRNPDLMWVNWLVNDVFSKKIMKIGIVGDEIFDDEGDLVGVENEVRPGDVFRVNNLTNGLVDEVVVDSQRRVRAHIASDKGDVVTIEVYRPDGKGAPMFAGSKIKAGATRTKILDTFEPIMEDRFFQTVEHEGGDQLVAIQEGLGYRRNTPSFRRLLAISQIILEPADPVNWAPRYSDPLDVQPEGKKPCNVLYVVTMGDMTVPTSTGIALGRAAGVIGFREDDPRWGVSENQLLINNHVTEGIEQLDYFRSDCCHAHCGRVNFDIDDLSDGRQSSDLPRLASVVTPEEVNYCGEPAWSCDGVVCEPQVPLRASVPNVDGYNAVRFPAVKATGMHAIDLPNPDLEFDINMFTINQIGLFLSSRGTVLSDHPCLARNDCRDCIEGGVEGDPDNPVRMSCPTIPAPTALPFEFPPPGSGE